MGEMLERSVWRKPSSRLSISAFSFAPSFCIEEVAKHGNTHTHLLGLKVANATSYFLRNKKLQETPPAEEAQPECKRDGWLTGCLLVWLGGWLAGWLVGWLAACLAGWLTG